jgi:hypothetical protein
MGILNKLFGSVSGLLNMIAPIAMFIPGMQWVSIAAMVANVAKGLTQNPPDWGGILTSLVSNALPMGLGKALGAFKGGTALDFAKTFSGKMGETLSEVASKVGNPQITNLVGQMQSKISSEAFQTKFANIVNTATKTNAGDQLTSEQIGKSLNNIAYQTRDLLGPMAGQLTYPLTQATSSFSNAQDTQPVVPQPPAGVPVISDAPTMRVTPDYRG